MSIETCNDGDSIDIYQYYEERVPFARRRDDVCPCCGASIVSEGSLAIIPLAALGWTPWFNQMEIVCQECREWVAWYVGKLDRGYPYPALNGSRAFEVGG